MGGKVHLKIEFHKTDLEIGVIPERGQRSFSLFFRLFEKHKQYEEMQQNCTDQSNRIDDLNDLINDLQGALAAKSADVER